MTNVNGPGQIIPDFIITGCHTPGGIQFYATRDIRAAELAVGKATKYGDGTTTLEAVIGNLLIARVPDWIEAFEVIARRWQQEDEIQNALHSTGATGIKPAKPATETWVRMVVPDHDGAV